MYRVRFHGRGGQGMKMASHILGTAFFLSGFEVQDAPRFGAERRGAPIFAYVRADHDPIKERGIVNHPDLVIVADASLATMAAAGILAGVKEDTVLFLNSRDKSSSWRKKIHVPAHIISENVVGDDLSAPGGQKFFGAICAGAAAALLGKIEREVLVEAIAAELEHLGDEMVRENQMRASSAFDAMSEHTGIVKEGVPRPAQEYTSPAWIDIPHDEVDVAAPAIHGSGTSELMKTGSWRLVRPVIDPLRCKGCWWVCSTLCPDSAIAVNDGRPEIDYDHCKGCMICMVHCSAHAISLVKEHEAEGEEGEK